MEIIFLTWLLILEIVAALLLLTTQNLTNMLAGVLILALITGTLFSFLHT